MTPRGVSSASLRPGSPDGLSETERRDTFVAFSVPLLQAVRGESLAVWPSLSLREDCGSQTQCHKTQSLVRREPALGSPGTCGPTLPEVPPRTEQPPAPVRARDKSPLCPRGPVTRSLCAQGSHESQSLRPSLNHGRSRMTAERDQTCADGSRGPAARTRSHTKAGLPVLPP